MDYAPPPLPGDRLGPYLLGRTLGLGGVATVFEATDPSGVRVAVKVLHPGSTQFEQVRRFRREFVSLQSVHHPGVVRVLAVGRESELPWMAMEYVDGVDLEETLRRWAEAPPADRFARVDALLRALCAALGAVHAVGLIHRDIKPSNILITADGQPRLIDFGLVADMDTPTLSEGHVVGTFAFMAPEQARGGVVDSRSDLYALGVVLYALLTGTLPFQADTPKGYMSAQLSTAPRAPSELDPRIPPRLEQVCLRLMEKDPARRFASTRQVLAALDAAEGLDLAPVRGREDVLAAIGARVAALAPGAGGVVVVTGEHGLGKSVVLAEAVRRARDAGQDVAFSPGFSPDLFPGGEALLEHLAEQLPDLGASRDPVGTVAERLVRQARGRPWVLVIDDVDLRSGEDQDALTALVRDRVAVQGDPLLLVVSASTVDGPAAPLTTGAGTGLVPVHIALQGLAEPDVLLLVQDLGLSGGVARALAQRLARVLSGQPGAIKRQIAALESAGWLSRDGGVLGSTVGVELLRDAVLPGTGDAPALGEGQTAAEVLAVLGGLADPELLLGAGAELAALRTLASDGWISGGVSAASPVVFSNAALAAEIYRTLHADRRRALHRSAARAMRILGGPGGALHLGRVADHLLRGGAPEEAWPLLLEAARRQLSSQPQEEAARTLRRAFDIRGVAEPRMSVELCRRARLRSHAVEAELLATSGDSLGAARAFEAARALAEILEDVPAVLDASVGLGLARADSGDPVGAREVLEAVLPRLPQGDRRWASGMDALAHCHLGRGRVAEAEAAWGTLGSVGRAAGSRRMEGLACLGLGMGALARGALHEGAQALARAVALLRGSTEAGVALRRLGELALYEGDLARAVSLSEESLALAVSVGERLRAAGLGVLAAIAYGDPDEARRLVVATLPLALTLDATMGAPLALVRGLLNLGMMHDAGVLLARPDPAEDRLDAEPAQVLALKARLLAGAAPTEAWTHAAAALAAPRALLPWAAAWVAEDASEALMKVNLAEGAPEGRPGYGEAR